MVTPAVPLVPPHNQAGISLPPLPQNPPTYSDIGNAVDYVHRLLESRKGITPATYDVIGRAEIYKTALYFAITQACQTTSNALESGVANIQTDIAATRDEIRKDIQQLRVEQIILANSQAGNHGQLYDPTIPGRLALLTAPNPTCRDDLLAFEESQCVRSASELGLPLLPSNTNLVGRKRQIAERIGVPPMK